MYYQKNGNPVIIDNDIPEHLIDDCISEQEWFNSKFSLCNHYNNKYNEIINNANKVKSFLSNKYSVIEEQTWSQQEAGARLILNEVDECKDEVARAMISDSSASRIAIKLVTDLAFISNITKEEMSERIINNADNAYNYGILTLMEQRAFETKLKEAYENNDINAINNIEVNYTVLQNA